MKPGLAWKVLSIPVLAVSAISWKLPLLILYVATLRCCMCAPLLGWCGALTARDGHQKPDREPENASGVWARARKVRWGGIGCDPVKSCLLPSLTGSRSFSSMRRFATRSQRNGANDLRLCSERAQLLRLQRTR